MSKESFKTFVRTKPALIKFVQNGSMSWQKFYEMYELYGESSSVWNDYLGIKEDAKTFSLKDIVTGFKNMDMKDLQKGINSVQKGIDYVKDMFDEKTKNIAPKNTYEPRPMYKYFDD